MIKRYNQWILAAVLTFCSMAMLTSCSNSDDEEHHSGNNENAKTYNWVEPTTDQLAVRVTVDLPTASLSQFSDNSTGAALLRRLPQVTAAVTNNTELVLIKGSDVASQSDAVIAQMADVLAIGGYVAIERPTQSQLDLFMDKIEEAIAKVVKDCVEDLFDLTPEQTQATVNASMAGRMAMRRANLNNYTRAADTEKACAELIIYGPTDYYFEEPFDADSKVTTFYMDAEGNVLEEGKTENTFEPTPYHYGLIADGAAKWINDVEAMFENVKEWYIINEDNSSGASRRANGGTAINDIMNATETFSRSGQMFFTKMNGEIIRRPNRVMATIRTWGAHNIESNKDFYYVNENVMLRMGGSKNFDPFFCRGFANKDWMKEMHTVNGKEEPTGTLWYGNFLMSYEASMDLTGIGTITCEAATPETDNAVTTRSVNATESNSESNVVTHSLSTTAGWTGGNLGIARNYNYSNVTGHTKGNSFAMTNSKSIKDLNVVKNTTGTKVTWTYTGNLPKATGANNLEHEQPAEILVNDANLVNDACWSVVNPEGQYTLKVGSFPSAGNLVRYEKGDTRYQGANTTEDNIWDIPLLQPCRAMQTWRMFININEWEYGFRQGAQAELAATISKKFPDFYQNVFQVAEMTPGSVKNASAIIMHTQKVFDIYKDILQAIAKSFGIKKFTITWSSDKDLETRKGYTVTVK